MTLSKALAAAIAAAGILFGSGAANAATLVDFDLTGNGGLAPSYGFSNGGVGLTVTAGTFDNSGISPGVAYVGQYGSGLGVTSHWGDQHFVDGATLNDVLIFQFDTAVRFASVTFSYNDRNDDFRFFFENGGSGGLVDWGSDIDLPGSGFYSTYVFNGTWVGDQFGIGAYGANDEFKVKGVGVELSVVPIPASVLMLGSGLALLGWFGMRAKRNQGSAAIA